MSMSNRAIRNIVLSSMVCLSIGLNAYAQTEGLDPEVVAADEAYKAGIQLYYLKGCYACHGPQAEGVLAKGGPKLTGLSADYIARQLTHFRDGVRGASFDDVNGRQMPMAANSLTDQQVQLLAGFLASLQPKIVAEQFPLGGDAERGKALYDARCLSCHGPGGSGNAALNGPALAGQQNSYLVRQYKIYQSGVRGEHSADIYGQQMRAVANLLESEEDIVDVATYLGAIGKPVPAEVANDRQAVVTSFYARLDGGDKQALFDLLDPDVVFHFPTQTTVGPHGYWGFVSQVGAYIPDYKHDLEELSIDAEDETIVVVGRIKVYGTTAAGVPLEFPGSGRYRVENGKIVEVWVK